MNEFPEHETQVNRSSSEVDLLRSLLVSPEMEAVGELRGVVDELQGQLKDRDQLITLLLPVITDVLRRRVAESSDTVAKAIAPIIDKAIHEKTLQDRESIAAVIGPIITEALKKEIHLSPEDMAKALAPVSARAIAQQHAASPQEVAHDLAPIIGGAIKEQIRSERDAIVDALYPVIGSTIAKYMSETLNNLVQTINVKIEQSLSMEGLKRKALARFKGVSEAELLMKEAMPFKIDAVFLIHKSSGLVIAESQNPSARLLDSDLLSGMLTAIRSLFNESLAQSGRVSELDQIEYGRSKIVLEVAGYCYLAAVVDGVPTQDFINAMRMVLSRIVEEADAAIRHYSGDASAIPPTVNEKIRSLLTLPLASTEKKQTKPYPLFMAVGVLLLLILIPLGITLYRDNRDQDLAVRASAALKNTFPGDQINVGVERDQLELTGIVVNPYIRSQAALLVKRFAPEATIRNELTLEEQPPLSALTESQVGAVTSVLNGVEGVSLTSRLNEGDLLLRGTVEDAHSLTQVQKAFARIPGICSISNMIEVKHPAIENRIYFDVGSSVLRPSERTKILLLKQWLDRHPLAHLNILGHNDQSGPDAVNRRLAQNRATAMRDKLIAMGIRADRLVASGRSDQIPPTRPPQGSWAHRCVRFEIIDDPVGAKK